MKVVHIYQTNPFSSEQGGGVRYIVNLVNSYSNDVDILFLGIGEKEVRIGNIHFIPITKRMTPYPWFLIKLWIYLVLNRLDINAVVHIHRIYFVIPQIFTFHRNKTICTLHGRTFTSIKKYLARPFDRIVEPLFRMVEAWCFRKISYFAPVSDDVVDSFSKQHRLFKSISNNKIDIFPPLIKPSDFNIDEKEEQKIQVKYGVSGRYFIFIGRLSHIKDIPFLIEIFSKNKDYFISRSIQLLIAGGGEEYATIQNIIKESKLDGLVCMLGVIPSDDIKYCLNGSLGLLISSLHESGPYVSKEALMMGVPVITNNVGEVGKYIVNGQNGYIVKKQVDEYFIAMKNIVDSLEGNSSDKIKEQSYPLLKYSFNDVVAKKYEKVYRTFIEEGKQ